MSELREEILGAGVNKKKAIGVVLIAILLISTFAYSVYFISFLFGSQRPSPNKPFDTPEEDALLVIPPLPIDILTALMDYLLQNLDDYSKFLDLLDPQDFADVISNMMDGDIDNFDINDFSQALLAILGAAGALLLGEQEIFRVYDYDSLVDMQDVLWKYESFDEYNEYEWLSNAATEVIDFIPLSEYYSQYSSLDILKIKMDITPSAGPTSMVLPNLFPYPYVMEDSFSASNLVPGSPLLNKDDFNCSLIGLDFSSSDAVNLTFELFGENLPTEQDISSSAVYVTSGSGGYTSLLNQFTQLPPTVNDYINTHPNFKSHYDALDLLIGDNDNSYEIASIIKNYLQTNFIFSWDAIMSDPAGDTEDIVEWFSEHGEGLYAEFASAFVVFARAFEVPSRFVDGYRSVSMGQIEEIYDSQESKNAVLIKYKHLYNWAEIFIPTDITGNGYWIQFDIEPESASQGQFSLTLNSNFTAGFRPSVANLTATLSSLESSVANRTIIFTDLTSGGTTIGQVLTDQNGQASILVDINDTQVVGPHPIVANFSTLAGDTTGYVVYGDIEVKLLSVNPTLVNRSISNSTTIQGYVMDAIANQRVENATIEFLILDFGTNNKIANPFDIVYTNTDSNGNFNTITNVDPSVIRGNYEIRVDFNGSWNGVDLAFGAMSNSSSRIEFNVTEDISFDLLFMINGIPTDYPLVPVLGNLVNVKRSQQLNLSITVLDEISKTPVAGEIVEFYDYSNGNVLFASNLTDSNGLAWTSYNIVGTHKSGPGLVYAQVGRYINYSYFIVNESVGFDLGSLSGPNPRVINRTGIGIQFDVFCQLFDTNSNTIDYTEIELQMYDGLFDRSNLLNPQYPVFYDAGGIFNINNIEVQSYTDAKNYTLDLVFNGGFKFTNDPSNPYQYDFNINYLSNTTALPFELKVIDPDNVNITLAIWDSTFAVWNQTRDSYDDLNPPTTFNQSDVAKFNVTVFHTLSLNGKTVEIYDDFSNTLLQNYTFVTIALSASVQFNISTALPILHAGLHRIRVQYHIYSAINITYIIINGTTTIVANSNKDQIIRGADSFIVSGTAQDGVYTLRGLDITINLLNASFNDVSGYLNLPGSQSIIINNDGTFSYTINNIFQICPQGQYYIIINFSGSIKYPDTGFPDVDLTNYMINTNSSVIPLNITAGTIITQNTTYTKYEGLFPNTWQNGDTLYVIGNLTWDNGTFFSNMYINVTIRKVIDGSVVAINVSVLTDKWGGFNVSLLIDTSWPTFRTDTEIWVYFDPTYNSVNYVENSELEFT